MSGTLWVEMTLLVEMHQIWRTDAFSMRHIFIFLVIAHTANTGLQGAMRGTGLVMIITRFRHCLWHFMMKYGNYDIDLTLSWTGSGVGSDFIISWSTLVQVMAFFLFDTKPLPEPMYWEQTGTIGYTMYWAICNYHLRYTNQWYLFGTISIGIDIQHFQWTK